MLLRDNASDTQSLASFTSQNQTQWGTEFINTIYKACALHNPGLAIDIEAVFQIRDTIVHILNALLELRASTVVELDRRAGERIIPKTCEEMRKEAWIAMEKSALVVKRTRLFMNKPHELHTKMLHLVRESHPVGVRDKRDRVTEKELDRIAIYLNSLCEIIAEDILKWTGNYVKNIGPDAEPKINLQNLKIAMSSDRVGYLVSLYINQALIDLTSSMSNEEDDAGSTFLSHFYDDEEEKPFKAPQMTYETIAREFLKEERLYLRELKHINVYRKRLYELCDDKNMLKELFGNYIDIYEITIKVERLLEDYIETGDTHSIGFGFSELTEGCDYLSYVLRDLDNDVDAEQPFYLGIQRSLYEIFNSEKYQYLLEKGTEYIDNRSFRMTLQYVLPELLKAPILHFFHYFEFVTSTNSEEDKSELFQAKSYLSNIVNKIERAVGQHLDLKFWVKMDQAARNETKNSNAVKLKNIESSIDGFEGTGIAETCLALIKEGELTMVRPSYTGSLEQPIKGKWSTPRYFYLFDQMLLLCKKHKTTKFKDRFPTQLISTINLEDTAAIQNAFRIEVCSRPEEEKKYFTFICRTREEKDAWVLAFVKTTTRSLVERQINFNDKEETKKYPLVIPTADQYRFAEPDSDENITFEDYTSSSGIPVVKNATIVKLVERLTYHQRVLALYPYKAIFRYSSDHKFIQTFLISFRSFCKPQELLKLLEERFYVPEPKLQDKPMRGGPLMGRYDTVQSHGLSTPPSLYNEQVIMRFRKEYERPIQRSVLNVLNQWVKQHYYDFANDPELLCNLRDFLDKNSTSQGKLVVQYKKMCKNILNNIEKNEKMKNNEKEKQTTTKFSFSEQDVKTLNGETHSVTTVTARPQIPEVLWHTAKKGDIMNYDLLTLHPLEVGRQLTLLHFDLYKAIRPIELAGAAWMKHDKRVTSPQLLRLTDHTNMLIYWVSRSIVETESLEERVALMSRVIEVMSVFEELHNFTGLVAFKSALQSASVGRLSLSREKLSRDKHKRYEQIERLYADRHWKDLHRRMQNINPPCVPFFGMYMTEIYVTAENNKTFVNSPISKEIPESQPNSPPASKPKKVLVSFFKCRKISEIIREIQMYQNMPYSFQTEPTIRQFFEQINPKNEFASDDDLEEYLFKCSKKIEPGKEGDPRPPEVPPRHPPHVLKSPGIKAPKTGSTSSSGRSFSTQTSTAPSTPSFEETPLIRNVEDMAIVTPRLPSDHDKKLPTIGLIPPPLPVKKIAKTSAPPTPSTSSPLNRRQASAMSPPVAKSPSPTPLSARRLKETQAFIFPTMNMDSPLLPPKRSPPPLSQASSPSDPQVLNVVLKNENNALEPVSPSVHMVVPLHPPKIPPRLKKTETKTSAPPELPPKTYKRLVSNSNTSSSNGNLSPPFIFSNSTNSGSVSPSRTSPPPPPLPPKTYKKFPPLNTP